MAKPIYTDAQVVSSLTNTGGAMWKNPVISYNFPTSGSPYMIETWGASHANANQQAMTDYWMKAWDDVIGSSIVRVADSARANIGVANTYYTDYAHSYYPSSSGASVWFNPSFGAAAGSGNLLNPSLGQWGGMSFGHELGHALGLSHPGAYNGGRPTYEASAMYMQDSQQYTIMSYFEASKTGSDWIASNNSRYYAQTPMMNDIMAIQSLYGADKATRGADTTYGFHSTVGGSVFDFSVNKHPVLCIYDAGGNDTLDLSGFNTSSRISLVAGTFSDCDAMTSNISIARSVTLENALGGRANDVLVGNDANNLLNGGGGADAMSGGRGNDIYVVDTVLDRVTEQLNQGTDLVQSSVSYGLSADVENLTLSGSAAINGTGNDLGNVIVGNRGNNILDGGQGADTLSGGLGNDSYILDSSLDKIIEGFGQGLDTVFASISYALGANTENLTLIGTAAINGTGNELRNVIIGNGANNILMGGAGDDTLIGGVGLDRLTGGVGADKFGFIGLSDSSVGSNRDVITDFNAAQGDRIDFSLMDAGLKLPNNQAVHWADGGFTAHAGEVCMKGDILMCDVNGDAKADFEVQLIGVTRLSHDAVML